MRQYKLEKEVERIVFQKEATGKKHQNACKSESEAAEMCIRDRWIFAKLYDTIIL